MYQSNRTLNIPPGQPPGHLNFLKIFIQIPSSRGRNVQMPHYRSIPGDQMPPPPGNFSVASVMLGKLCNENMDYRQHSYMPKIIQMVLEYLQIESKACASLCFSASLPQIGYLSLWIKACLRHDLSRHVESARRNMKSKLAIKFPTPYE